MKRFYLLIGLVIFIAFISPVYASAEQGIAQFTIGSRSYTNDGQVFQMDVEPYMENSRSYVPIRYIAYALGIAEKNVIWDTSTQSVYLIRDNISVRLNINGNIIWKNGTGSIMDVCPQIRYNRTFLPARYVAEAFGATVEWNQPSRSVIILQATATNTNASSVSGTSTYQWEYNGDKWTWNSGIDQTTADQALAYYSTLPHPHRTQADYVLTYCMDRTDNQLLKPVVTSLKDGAAKQGYDVYDTVGMVIAFVQSFSYVSDSQSTGFDEYPRYPVETLLAKEGDCEDTSILTATLLRELGYGTALIFFDNHCAVGIKGSDTLTGSYYTVKGTRYYYVETTAKGWTIGEIPDQYKDQKAIVLPLP